jgi:hypothetical protein
MHETFKFLLISVLTVIVFGFYGEGIYAQVGAKKTPSRSVSRQTAVTEDGQKVVLQSDGVWWYESGAKSSRANRQFDLVGLWNRSPDIVIVDSMEKILEFPDRLPGFAAMPDGVNYWNEPFKTRGTVRLFQGDDSTKWQSLPSSNNEDTGFPGSMNRCGAGMWLVRWRADHPHALIEAAVGFNWEDDPVVLKSKIGRFGYMKGTKCDEPMFRFSKMTDGSTSQMIDLRYEIRFFEVRP